MKAIIDLVNDCNASFMRMPLWVRLWIVIALGGVNLFSFFMLDSQIGVWTAIAAALVLAFNTPTLMIQRGWGKALAISHLFIWIPLIVIVARKLLDGDAQFAPYEYMYGVLVVIVNSISIAFDINDTKEFIQGNREVA